MEEKSIYYFSKEIGLEPKTILSVSKELGFEVQSVQSILDNEQQEILKDYFSSKAETVKKVKPKKDKLKWKPKLERKPKKGKAKSEEKIRPKVYHRQFQLTRRTANIVMGGVIGLLLVSSLGSAVAYFSAKQKVEKQRVNLVSTSKRSVIAPVQTNYEAQIFLNNYVETYFDYPSDPKDQQQAMTTLNSFYGGSALPLASQGQMRNSSALVSSELVSLTKDKASFYVRYVVKKDVLETLFSVTYSQVGNGYVVTSYPTFSNVPEFVGKVSSDNQISLGATTALSRSETKKLNAFVKALLTAKTTSQSSLDLVSDGLSVSTNEKLKTVDYTFYQKESNGKYHAVVQATFSDNLGTHAEDFVFEISKNKNSYFAFDFSNVITKRDVTPKGAEN